MVAHFINGQEPVIEDAVLEWQLTFSPSMKGPVLQARNPGGEWINVLCIDEDGVLDPTFSPLKLRGLQLTDEGHIDCVECYRYSYDEEADVEHGERTYTIDDLKLALKGAGLPGYVRHAVYSNLPAKGE